LDLAGQATVQGEALALEQVAQWVAANGVNNPAKTLAIKADGQIQAKQLGQWVAALRQAKVAKITLYSQKPTSNTP
jgi:biopolymer transport protein ExbD